MDLNYIYGNFTGESALDRKIKKAESEMKKAKELEEERLIKIFDDENYRRLSAMPVKDMSFAEIEILNEIKKGQNNIGKVYAGESGGSQSEPNIAGLTEQVRNASNSLIPMIQNRGVAVQPIPEGASLQNILAFCNSFRDALKNSQQPVSGIEEPDDWSSDDETVAKKYTRNELLTAKSAIEKMLKKMD